MVVRLDAGRDAIRAYVQEQAKLGLDHVRTLVRGEGDAIMASILDLSESEDRQSPVAGEFSALQVLQHLNGNFSRSIDRLQTLSGGRVWTSSGPGVGPGNIPGDSTASFVEAREQFEAGTSAVLAVLEATDPSRGLGLTAPHAAYGDFNWLEWAVYSHHVHTHDHVGQLQQIRENVRKL